MKKFYDKIFCLRFNKNTLVATLCVLMCVVFMSYIVSFLKENISNNGTLTDGFDFKFYVYLVLLMFGIVLTVFLMCFVIRTIMKDNILCRILKLFIFSMLLEFEYGSKDKIFISSFAIVFLLVLVPLIHLMLKWINRKENIKIEHHFIIGALINLNKDKIANSSAYVFLALTAIIYYGLEWDMLYIIAVVLGVVSVLTFIVLKYLLDKTKLAYSVAFVVLFAAVFVFCAYMSDKESKYEDLLLFTICIIMLQYILNNREVTNVFDIRLNNYRPNFYKLLCYDSKYDDFIYINEDVVALGYKKNVLDTNPNLSDGTLIQINTKHITNANEHREIELVVRKNNVEGTFMGIVINANKCYKIKLKITKSSTGDSYISELSTYNYNLMYGLFLSFVMSVSNKISNLSKKNIDIISYMRYMFRKNYYYTESVIEQTISNAQVLTKEKGCNYIDGGYGVGKTKFAIQILTSQGYNIEQFSYTKTSFNDITSEVLNRLNGRFSMSWFIKAGGIIGAVFVFVELYINFISKTFKGLKSVNIDNLNKMFNEVDLFEVNLMSRDIVIGVAIITIICLCALLMSNSSIFHLVNFGSSKNSDVLTREISIKLKSGNKKVILDDLDRKLQFVDIYNELEQISYMYKSKSEDTIGIINLDSNNIIKKVGEFYYSQGVTKVLCSPAKGSYYGKWFFFKRDIDPKGRCKKCIKYESCDFVQLMLKHFEEIKVDFSEALHNYIGCINVVVQNLMSSYEGEDLNLLFDGVEIDNLNNFKLYTKIRNIKNFRELKNDIEDYLSQWTTG